MIFTVAVVVVIGEILVDGELDTSSPVIQHILSTTAHNQDSFEVLTVNIVPQSKEEISSLVRNVIDSNSVDWIVVVGGIGFEDNDCTPEVSYLIQRSKTFCHNNLNRCCRT